jgi:pimeloyl-ACP methyl ester carboxylesterase
VFGSRAAARLLLGAGGTALRRMMRPIGARAGLYATAMSEPGRLTAALNWYRAISSGQFDDVGKVAVPTTYVWSDGDPAVGKAAALATATWVAADYRFVALRGIGHWVPEEAPRALADVALARIGV